MRTALRSSRRSTISQRLKRTAPAAMYIGSSQFHKDTASNWTFDPYTIAGVAVGDTIIVGWYMNNGDGLLSLSSGWVAAARDSRNGVARLIWRKLDGSANDTLTVTQAAGTTYAVSATAWRNLHATNPILGTPHVKKDQSSVPVTLHEVTAGGAALTLAFYYSMNSDDQPNGMTGWTYAGMPSRVANSVNQRTFYKLGKGPTGVPVIESGPLGMSTPDLVWVMGLRAANAVIDFMVEPNVFTASVTSNNTPMVVAVNRAPAAGEIWMVVINIDMSPHGNVGLSEWPSLTGLGVDWELLMPGGLWGASPEYHAVYVGKGHAGATTGNLTLSAWAQNTRKDLSIQILHNVKMPRTAYGRDSYPQSQPNRVAYALGVEADDRSVVVGVINHNGGNVNTNLPTNMNPIARIHTTNESTTEIGWRYGNGDPVVRAASNAPNQLFIGALEFPRVLESLAGAVIDHFNTPNLAGTEALSGRVPSEGAAWEITHGAMTVADNAAKATSAPGAAKSNLPAGNFDGVFTVGLGAGGGNAGVQFRITDANNYWKCALHNDNTVKISRISGGVETVVQSWAITNASENHQIAMRQIGDRISVWETRLVGWNVTPDPRKLLGVVVDNREVGQGGVGPYLSTTVAFVHDIGFTQRVSRPSKVEVAGLGIASDVGWLDTGYGDHVLDLASFDWEPGDLAIFFAVTDPTSSTPKDGVANQVAGATFTKRRTRIIGSAPSSTHAFHIWSRVLAHGDANPSFSLKGDYHVQYILLRNASIKAEAYTEPASFAAGSVSINGVSYGIGDLVLAAYGTRDNTNRGASAIPGFKTLGGPITAKWEANTWSFLRPAASEAGSTGTMTPSPSDASAQHTAFAMVIGTP